MKLYTTFFLLFVFTLSISSIELSYKFDSSYRIESTVYQNVLFNNKIELSSVILNKYSVEVVNTNQDKAKLDVKHEVYQESKNLIDGFYTKTDKQSGLIFQNINGLMEPITNKYFPGVQNVPYLPNKDLIPGDSWTNFAVEYFDLSNAFQINDVIKANFRVFYNYIGLTNINNRDYATIKINYNIYEKITPYLEWGDFFPVKISGSSNQTLYWDVEKGRPFKVEDKYFLEFLTSTGDKYTFKGNTESMSWPKNNLDSTEFKNMVQELKNTPQTTIIEDDEKLKITFNSLLFDPESYLLKENVKKYLDSIGKTLLNIGDINLRIIGHTALFGESLPGYLEELSTNRAKSVALYLIEKGYISKESLEVIGMGGAAPVDTNDTVIGRSFNRRVEIDILKN